MQVRVAEQRQRREAAPRVRRIAGLGREHLLELGLVGRAGVVAAGVEVDEHQTEAGHQGDPNLHAVAARGGSFRFISPGHQASPAQ